MPRLFTLCIVRDRERVLLGMKKRGFGEGRWNGFGGKVMEGENVVDSTARELREEAGIEAKSLHKAGILNFSFEDDPEKTCLEVHVFRVDEFSGVPRESEEMRPQWFGRDEIPYGEMWSSDKFWLPLFLAGKRFRGAFHFKDSTSNIILRQSLEEVNELL